MYGSLSLLCVDVLRDHYLSLCQTRINKRISKLIICLMKTPRDHGFRHRFTRVKDAVHTSSSIIFSFSRPQTPRDQCNQMLPAEKARLQVYVLELFDKSLFTSNQAGLKSPYTKTFLLTRILLTPPL